MFNNILVRFISGETIFVLSLFFEESHVNKQSMVEAWLGHTYTSF